MRKIIAVFVLLIVPLFTTAQSANNFDKVWVQGGPLQYATVFNSIGISQTLVDTGHRDYFHLGHSNICDSLGALVLCTNGYTVYDKHLDIVEGGDTVVSSELAIAENGWSSYSQSSIFLPFRNKIYYLVTPNATDSNVRNLWMVNNAQFDQMIYARIDMSMNSGAGKVVKKKVVILDSVRLNKVQMMACKHGNGMDWWLLKHDFGNLVYKFLFKQDTVLGPFIDTLPISFATYNQGGQSVFSRDGTKYATICRGAQKVYLADFDRCTGKLTNSNQEYSSMYLGPDDKLYIGNWNGFASAMSVINNPNSKGAACNFCPKCLRFPPLMYRNLLYNTGIDSPPCMPNYRLGAANPICWATGVEETQPLITFSVYPNPATTTLQFEYNNAGKVVLTDITGRLVKSVQLPAYSSKQSIDISNLPAGVYVYEYLVGGQQAGYGKLMIR